MDSGAACCGTDHFLNRILWDRHAIISGRLSDRDEGPFSGPAEQPRKLLLGISPRSGVLVG